MAVHLALMAAPLVVTKLKQFGMSENGARQALRGEMITNPQDRARVAVLLAEAYGDGQAGRTTSHSTSFRR